MAGVNRGGLGAGAEVVSDLLVEICPRRAVDDVGAGAGGATGALARSLGGNPRVEVGGGAGLGVAGTGGRGFNCGTTALAVTHNGTTDSRAGNIAALGAPATGLGARAPGSSHPARRSWSLSRRLGGRLGRRLSRRLSWAVGGSLGRRLSRRLGRRIGRRVGGNRGGVALAPRALAVGRGIADNAIWDGSVEAVGGEEVASASAVDRAGFLARIGGLDPAELEVAVPIADRVNTSAVLAVAPSSPARGGGRGGDAINAALSSGARGTRAEPAVDAAGGGVITVLPGLDDAVSTRGLIIRKAALDVVGSLEGHGGLDLIADLGLVVSRMKLVNAVEESIAVVHDAPSGSLAFLEGVVGPEVMADLVGNGQPRGTRVGAHSCTVVVVAQNSHIGEANGARGAVRGREGERGGRV